MMRRILVVLCLLAVVMVGCGDDDADDLGADGATTTSAADDTGEPAAEPFQFDVTSVDFGYELAATEVPAGTVDVVQTNEGDVEHQVTLIRLDEGQTPDQLRQVIADEGDDALDPSVFAGGTNSIPAGESNSAVVDLTPGEYVAYCFIPDHAAQGMVEPFTVTGETVEPVAQDADTTVGLENFAFDVPDDFSGQGTVEVTYNGDQPQRSLRARPATSRSTWRPATTRSSASSPTPSPVRSTCSSACRRTSPSPSSRSNRRQGSTSSRAVAAGWTMSVRGSPAGADREVEDGSWQDEVGIVRVGEGVAVGGDEVEPRSDDLGVGRQAAEAEADEVLGDRPEAVARLDGHGHGVGSWRAPCRAWRYSRVRIARRRSLVGGTQVRGRQIRRTVWRDRTIRAARGRGACCGLGLGLGGGSQHGRSGRVARMPGAWGTGPTGRARGGVFSRCRRHRWPGRDLGRGVRMAWVGRGICRWRRGADHGRGRDLWRGVEGVDDRGFEVADRGGGSGRHR
jgi:uncharacterized cupredoxin-like copper-binding protein